MRIHVFQSSPTFNEKNEWKGASWGAALPSNLSGAGAELFQIRCWLGSALGLGRQRGEYLHNTRDQKCFRDKKKQKKKHLLGLLGQEWLFNRDGPGGVKVAWKSGSTWGSASARSSVELR